MAYRDHLQFLQREVEAQKQDFQDTAQTPCMVLREKEELFLCLYAGVSEKTGHTVLKFASNRALPRRNAHLTCVLVDDKHANYKEWGDMSYEELSAKARIAFNVVCVWHGQEKDSKMVLAGFKGFPVDLHDELDTNVFLVLGPQYPPLDYLYSLIDLLKTSNKDSRHASLLDIANHEQNERKEQVQTLQKDAQPQFFLKQLEVHPELLIQGPPGTGKTTLVAGICKELLRQEMSVLVMALTNRALIEVAKKDVLAEFLTESHIGKVNLSAEEAHEVKGIHDLEEPVPIKKNVCLATFFTASRNANASAQSEKPFFDYVIMDEASQGLLSTFAMAKALGKKVMYVGDPMQLPPIISQNKDKVKNEAFYEALTAIFNSGYCPKFKMGTTYRLTPRNAAQTSVFYHGELKSDTPVPKHNLKIFKSQAIQKGGGITFVPVQMQIGDKKPKHGLEKTRSILSSLHDHIEPIHVSVLTFYVESTKWLQYELAEWSAKFSQRLLIDTVSRVQGLTTDVCIYMLPNTGYGFSLEPRLFNVATSRATRHSLVLGSDDLFDYQTVDQRVKNLLSDCVIPT